MFKDFAEQNECFNILSEYSLLSDGEELNLRRAFDEKLARLYFKTIQHEKVCKFDYSNGQMSGQRQFVLRLIELIAESTTPKKLNGNLLEIKDLLYKVWIISLDISLNNMLVVTGSHLKNIKGGRAASEKTHGTLEEKLKNRALWQSMIDKEIEENPLLSFEKIKELVIKSTENKKIVDKKARATVRKLKDHTKDTRKSSK